MVDKSLLMWSCYCACSRRTPALIFLFAGPEVPEKFSLPRMELTSFLLEIIQRKEHPSLLCVFLVPFHALHLPSALPCSASAYHHLTTIFVVGTALQHHAHKNAMISFSSRKIPRQQGGSESGVHFESQLSSALHTTNWTRVTLDRIVGPFTCWTTFPVPGDQFLKLLTIILSATVPHRWRTLPCFLLSSLSWSWTPLRPIIRWYMVLLALHLTC